MALMRLTYPYIWHGKMCKIMVRPIFKRGIKRNAMIELLSGEQIIVPWRAIRRVK